MITSNCSSFSFSSKLCIYKRRANLLLHCDFILLQETQYAKWKAACILASKGKTMAYSSYKSEVRNIQSFLQMKSLAPPPGHAAPDLDAMEMNADCFVSPRYAKKHKTKQVSLKASCNTLDIANSISVTSLNIFSKSASGDFFQADSTNLGGPSEHSTAVPNGSQDALHPGLAVTPRVWYQLLHCQVWRIYLDIIHIQLVTYLNICILFMYDHLRGSVYICSRFKGSKKDEILGISYNRLIRLDMSSGLPVTTWRFANMKQWNVNWEIRQVRDY